MKYKVQTRDWKGNYSGGVCKGWKLFADEDDINTGTDAFARFFCKGKPKGKKMAGQDVYDLWEELLCDDVERYTLDEDEIIVEK
jgi:hypothetical protein